MSNLPKLIRDGIPKLIRERGASPKIRLLDSEELNSWLVRKLREEVSEFEKMPSIEELADILEVVISLTVNLGVTFEDVEKERKRKFLERGGFQQGICSRTLRSLSNFKFHRSSVSSVSGIKLCG